MATVEFILFLLLAVILYFVSHLYTRRLHRALEEAEQFNAHVITSAAEGIIVYDANLCYVSWNPFMEALTGLPAVDVVGKPAISVFPHLRAWCVEERLKQALHGEIVVSPDTWYNIPRTGKSGWVAGTYAPHRNSDGEIIGVIGLLRDVTERKRIEQELGESEERYRSQFTNTNAVMLVLDPDSLAIVDANPAACTFYGYSHEELIAKKAFELNTLPPRQLRAEYQRAVNGQCQHFLFKHRRANGELRDVEVYTGPITVQGFTLLYSIIHDITDRQLSQEALAAEKERLAVTLRSIDEGVITTDFNGRVVLMNRVAETLTGWSSEEAAGRPFAEIFQAVHVQTRLPGIDPITHLLDTNGAALALDPLCLIAHSGAEHIIMGSAAPMYDAQNNIIGVVVAFRDDTERQRMDEELRKTGRLDSLTTLAGGITHDFNNILATIFGNLSLVKLRMSPDDPMRMNLDNMENAALRARDLTAQLLSFTRDDAADKQVVAVINLIRESVGFALAGANVRPEYALADDLHLAEVDAAQFSQLLNNLVSNAVQAMPDGGILHVRAHNTFLTGKSLPAPAGPYLCISIRDDGVGIPAQVRPRIFDPFFTTKAQARGLGLTTAYSIVKTHGGYITVDSIEGAGTTATVYLPAVIASTKHTSPLEILPSMEPSHGRILVMDDNKPLREVIASMVSALGYEAETADNGQVAVQRYSAALARGCRFDAVILDLTVPGGLGGKETLARLLSLDAHVVAIATSGYAADPVMAHPARYGFRAVIAKPYRISDLAAILTSVLTPTERGALN